LLKARHHEAQTTRKQRITGSRIHRQLVEEGYAVGMTAVRNHLRQTRRRQAEVLIPLIHRPGNEARVRPDVNREEAREAEDDRARRFILPQGYVEEGVRPCRGQAPGGASRVEQRGMALVPLESAGSAMSANPTGVAGLRGHRYSGPDRLLRQGATASPRRRGRLKKGLHFPPPKTFLVAERCR